MNDDNRLEIFLNDNIIFLDETRTKVIEGKFLRAAFFMGVYVIDSDNDEIMITHDKFKYIKNLDSDDDLCYSFGEIDFNECEERD